MKVFQQKAFSIFYTTESIEFLFKTNRQKHTVPLFFFYYLESLQTAEISVSLFLTLSIYFSFESQVSLQLFPFSKEILQNQFLCHFFSLTGK